MSKKRRYAYKGHFIRHDPSGGWSDSGMWELILKPGFHFQGYGDGITDGKHTSLSDTRAEAKDEVNERVISECRCPRCTDPESKVYHDQLLTGERS